MKIKINFITLFLLIAVCFPTLAQSRNNDWPRYSFNYSNTNNNSHERQIKRKTAPFLRRAWDGYGFVLAPYLAKILSEYIVNGTTINKTIVPARFFARWARRR